MTTLTHDELARLRQVAEAATPGAMHVQEYYENTIAHHLEAYERMMRQGYMDGPEHLWPAMHFVEGDGYTFAITGNGPKSRPNAHFIAAFDPPTCCALLDTLAEAQQRLAMIDATNSEAEREAKDILRESNMFRAERDRLAAQVSAMRGALGEEYQVIRWRKEPRCPECNSPQRYGGHDEGCSRGRFFAALASAESEGGTKGGDVE